MDREGWRSFLKRWSQEWIVGHDPERDRPLDEDVTRDGWLGFAPASAQQVVTAEQRLGRSLPPSLREFLLVSNGWRNAGSFIYRLAGTSDLAWLRDTEDAHWIDAYGTHDLGSGDMLRRSMRISLDGDSAVLLLDPDDIDPAGEWAGYWLASWSGMGPERHSSFYDLMYSMYARFHALRKPPSQTRDAWDARVEQARLAALDGQVDQAATVLEQAQAFGRDRATLLRFQLRAVVGDWYTVPLHKVVLYGDRAALEEDPLLAAELLPLLFVEDRLAHHRERFTLGQLARTGSEPVQRLIVQYQSRLGRPDFRLTFGNPSFDVAVHQLLQRLTTDPAFNVPDPFDRASRPGELLTGLPLADYEQARHVRQRLLDAAWPQLLEALALWRPVSVNHIAPVALFADPILTEMITPDRGRELLSTPRGGQS